MAAVDVVVVVVVMVRFICFRGVNRSKTSPPPIEMVAVRSWYAGPSVWGRIPWDASYSLTKTWLGGAPTSKIPHCTNA